MKTVREYFVPTLIICVAIALVSYALQGLSFTTFADGFRESNDTHNEETSQSTNALECDNLENRSRAQGQPDCDRLETNTSEANTNVSECNNLENRSRSQGEPDCDRLEINTGEDNMAELEINNFRTYASLVKVSVLMGVPALLAYITQRWIQASGRKSEN